MPPEVETPLEDREKDVTEEPRDRTKLLWVAVVGVFAIMIGVLFLTQKPSNAISQARAKHILISANMNDPADRQRALTRAKELRQRLVEGANFEQLAREFSNDPGSSQRGGDLGYAPKGIYDDPFDEYVWSGPVNEISDLIRTGRGYHIIVITDRRLSAADAHELKLQKDLARESGTASEQAETPKP